MTDPWRVAGYQNRETCGGRARTMRVPSAGTIVPSLVTPMHRVLHRAARLAALLMLLPAAATAQSLRGSRASIDRMHRQARAERLTFHETPTGVRRAAAKGRLVRLERADGVVLHGIGYPYVRPTTRTFVRRLGAQHQAACGEPLVVTSAVRPATRQPPNATARSVHPTGMAIDLRRSSKPACLRWLRATLLELEDAGLLEATEESSPPHFHVAVFPTPYARWASARAKAEARRATYTVRAGDTLSEIARAHDTTVAAIRRANELPDDTIRAGQEIRVPVGR